jgi:hypothetical protein
LLGDFGAGSREQRAEFQVPLQRPRASKKKMYISGQRHCTTAYTFYTHGYDGLIEYSNFRSAGLQASITARTGSAAQLRVIETFDCFNSISPLKKTAHQRVIEA